MAVDPLSQFDQDFQDDLLNGVDRLAAYIVDDIRESISIPVEYYGINEIRSISPEPPRTDTGRLWNSYQADPATPTEDGAETKLGSELDYAAILELGSEHIHGPRPHAIASLERLDGEMGDIFVEGMNKGSR